MKAESELNDEKIDWAVFEHYHHEVMEVLEMQAEKVEQLQQMIIDGGLQTSENFNDDMAKNGQNRRQSIQDVDRQTDLKIPTGMMHYPSAVTLTSNNKKTMGRLTSFKMPSIFAKGVVKKHSQMPKRVNA